MTNNGSHYSAGDGSDQIPHRRTDGITPRSRARGTVRSGSRFESMPEANGPTGRYVPDGSSPYAKDATRGAVGYTATANIPRGGRRPQARRGGRNGKRIGAVVLLAIAVIAVLLVLNPPIYSITVNGVRHSANWGTTLQDAMDGGWVTTKPGNLMAVDGSLLEEGGGTEFVANVNGQETTDPATHLGRDAQVTISDGKDVEEESTTETQSIDPGNAGSTDQNYWAGAIHVLSTGTPGEQVVKTGKVSGKTVTQVTKKPVDAGYSVYNVDTGGEKVVALTFDDGPWPDSTAQILDVLKDNDAKATFFEIGNQISDHKDLVKRIYDEGHQIGSHTWDHASGSGGGVDITKMSAEEQLQEVDKGFQAIDDAVGEKVSRVFRAPGGNYYGSTVTNLQGHVDAEIGWNVDTEDWSRPGVQAIVDAIESAGPGNVILMHDGGGDRSQTVEALRIALPVLRERGYKFVTIDELLAMDKSSTDQESSGR